MDNNASHSETKKSAGEESQQVPPAVAIESTDGSQLNTLEFEGKKQQIAEVEAFLQVSHLAKDKNSQSSEVFQTNPNQEYPFLSPPRGVDELGWLGEYRIMKLLGEGGMGFVFRGEDSVLNRPVALKVMRPEVAKKPQAAERFLREGRAAAGLKSDHVITIYQVGQANGVPFLAMEFLEGLPLDQWMKHQKNEIPLKHVLKIARDMLHGLSAAHEKGLIHRDIKPANLWLEKGTSRIILLDFGLTRSQDSSDQVTADGAVVGTPAFMAPEQAGGKPVDPRADLFSVGAVLYTLLARRNPFSRDGMMATLAAVSFEAHPSILQSRADIPKEYADFIDRLLSKKPDDRPANAKAALAELAAIERQLREAQNLISNSTMIAPLVEADHPAIVWGGIADEEGDQPTSTEKTSVTKMRSGFVEGPKKSSSKNLLIAGGSFAFLAITIGVTLFVVNKVGSKSKTEGSNSAEASPKDSNATVIISAKTNDSTKTEAPLVMDADRKAAEFVIKKGGSVGLYSAENRIYLKTLKELPKNPFKVTGINLSLTNDTKIGIIDSDLELFRTLDSVDSLRIFGTFTDSGVAKLSTFPLVNSVRHLELTSNQVTDEVFVSLAKFKSLVNLEIRFSPKIIGKGLSHLQGTQIELLHLNGTPIQDETIVYLKALPKLTHLQLISLPVSDAGMKFIGELTQLKVLMMQACHGVSNEGVKHLENCQALESLELGNNRVTGASLKSVGKLKNLIDLKAYYFDTGANEDELKFLSGCERINYIWIDGPHFKFTDTGLNYLSTLKHLKKLGRLKDSKITAEGFKKFKAALPNCQTDSEFEMK